MDRNRKEALAMRVSVVTILGNLALTIFKLAAGVSGSLPAPSSPMP